MTEQQPMACSVPQARLAEEQGVQFTAPAAPRVINVDKNAAYPKATGILPAQVDQSSSIFCNRTLTPASKFAGWAL